MRYGTPSERYHSARAWVERGPGPLRPAGSRSSVYSASGRDIPQRAIAGCRSALLSVTAAYGCRFLQRAVAPRAVALKPPPAVPSRLPIPCAVPSAPPQHPSQPNMPIALPKKLYKVRRRDPLCHPGALNGAPRSAPRPRAQGGVGHPEGREARRLPSRTYPVLSTPLLLVNACLCSYLRAFLAARSNTADVAA